MTPQPHSDLWYLSRQRIRIRQRRDLRTTRQPSTTSIKPSHNCKAPPHHFSSVPTISFADPSSPSKGLQRNPENVERYLHDHRLLDLVLKFQSSSGNVKGYLGLCSRPHSRILLLASIPYRSPKKLISLTAPIASMDPIRCVREALVHGVIAAKHESQRLGVCQ